MNSIRKLIFTICVCLLIHPVMSWGQANVVLRDLTLISDHTIASFDQDSVRLSDGSELSWDLILRGQVAADQQQEFDRYVREIGLPLFQMKQRIQVRDWARLNEAVDSLFVQYSGVDSAIGKTVCLASAKGKFETGARAEAVLPFLMASVKQSSLPEASLDAMGYQASELRVGVSNQLVPVWFDMASVTTEKQSLEAYADELGNKFPQGGFLYLASFCLALGEFEEAKQYAMQISDQQAALRQWKLLILSEVDRRTRTDIHRANKFQVEDDTLAEVRAASRYFDAVAAEKVLQKDDPVRLILEYVKVAAIWKDQFPNLSAAALYRAAVLAKSADMLDEADAISEELLRRYPKSYHGKMKVLEVRR